MQPQEGGGFDWMNAVTGAGGGAIATFLTWFWRAARFEPKIKLKFQEDFAELREQIGEVEKNSVTRDDLKDFRKEHRDDLQSIREQFHRDMADLKRNIALILGSQT